MSAQNTPDARSLRRKLQKRVGEALKNFRLIERGDRILIGLSGGKDSLALLDLLGERMARSNGYFAVEALHVRMRNIRYASDTQYLEEQCARWNIPFHCVETGFEPDRNERRTPCFLCSWHRRKVLFAQAQLLGCNKIALGHHQDDLLRTALMNLTFNGTFSTMAARLEMRKFRMTVIRPLACAAEDDLRRWAAVQGYRPVEKVCPYDAASNRTRIGIVVEALERLNPDCRHSLWHALKKAGALVEERTADGEARTAPEAP